MLFDALELLPICDRTHRFNVIIPESNDDLMDRLVLSFVVLVVLLLLEFGSDDKVVLPDVELGEERTAVCLRMMVLPDDEV